MTTQNNPIVIFDLDDTLFNEIDYLKSAFSEIAQQISQDSKANQIEVFDRMLDLYHNKSNVFDGILKHYKSKNTISDLVSLYRNHQPKITLLEGRKAVFDGLKSSGIKMGLLTDGRSKQQRSKIIALEIEHYFEEIIISEEFGTEKPNKNNYLHFEKQFGKGHYFYIGDNTSKDFVSPNKLGWTSVCVLDNGHNIHKQNFSLNKDYLPAKTIDEFSGLIKLIG
ncbi:HAD family hydrolase [Algibacter sp. 2305UL17-15]|uniref:HAD family hydrolase n=1 Tax=Algibacter sp. 2305UL17-15 TaxID=3231268 RepID=UPI003458380D